MIVMGIILYCCLYLYCIIVLCCWDDFNSEDNKYISSRRNELFFYQTSYEEMFSIVVHLLLRV